LYGRAAGAPEEVIDVSEPFVVLPFAYNVLEVEPRGDKGASVEGFGAGDRAQPPEFVALVQEMEPEMYDHLDHLCARRLGLPAKNVVLVWVIDRAAVLANPAEPGSALAIFFYGHTEAPLEEPPKKQVFLGFHVCCGLYARLEKLQTHYALRIRLIRSTPLGL
jgi:hypothetical protein